MLATSRPFVAAGVAVVGAGAIAISPVVLPDSGNHSAAAIRLAAATDWQDVFTTAGQNASALFDSWRQAPAPIVQQILANQQKYLSELPDLAGIGAQIQANAQRALGALLTADPSTLDATHRTLYQLLPVALSIPGVPQLLQFNISATGKQLLAFSTTALSGVLLGLAGPVLGPLLVLQSSMGSIAADLGAATPNVAGALATLSSIPAAMTDAFLNGGQHVDLTALATALGPSIGVTFPAGVQVGIALGGLLSPGGSIFNALDMAYDNNLLGLLHIHVPLATGNGIGPIGAMMELARSIATAIGWNGGTGAAAARTSLAAANEVPRSALAPTATASAPLTIAVDSAPDPKPSPAAGAAGIARGGTAGSARSRYIVPDKMIHAAAASGAGGSVANRATASAGRGTAVTGDAGKASTGRSNRAAAAG